MIIPPPLPPPPAEKSLFEPVFLSSSKNSNCSDVYNSDNSSSFPNPTYPNPCSSNLRKTENNIAVNNLTDISNSSLIKSEMEKVFITLNFFLY
jgi:hypothetical protein